MPTVAILGLETRDKDIEKIPYTIINDDCPPTPVSLAEATTLADTEFANYYGTAYDPDFMDRKRQKVSDWQWDFEYIIESFLSEIQPVPPPTAPSEGYRYRFSMKGETFTYLEPLDKSAIAPDVGGLVNVVLRGGVYIPGTLSVPAPVEHHVEDRYVLNATHTNAYRTNIIRRYGTVNADAVIMSWGETYQPGELCFVSCHGGIRTAEDWQITLGFSEQLGSTQTFKLPDPEGMDPDHTEQFFVEGHDTTWTLSIDALTQVGSFKIASPIPLGVYLVQPWPRSTWAGVLGAAVP